MRRLALLFVLVALVGAACGGQNDDAAAPAGEVVTQTTAPPAQVGGGAAEETAADGKALFLQNCSGCHTLSDAATTGKVGPNLDETKPSYDRVNSMVRNGGGGGLGVMPAFEGTLAHEQIETIARYVSGAVGS